MNNNFILSNSNIITVTRGDSFEAPIFINTGDIIRPIRYSLQENDRLYIGITEPRQYFEHSIIKKVYDGNSPKTRFGDTIFRLEPSDTEFLVPGTYYYQAKLQQFDENGKEYITTVIDKTLFYIVE